MNAARILILDDELSLRRLMRLYLTKAGFAVAEASTGPEALAALRRGNVDLAIVDVMLPEVDGFEVVRQARRNSSIPIILLTARGEEASRVAGLEIGADDYVVKPFLAHQEGVRFAGEATGQPGPRLHPGPASRRGLGIPLREREDHRRPHRQPAAEIRRRPAYLDAAGCGLPAGIRCLNGSHPCG